MEYLEIFTNISIIIGVILALLSFHADHLQRRRNSTFQFYEATCGMRREINKIFKDEIVYPNDSRYQNDEKLRETVIDLLNAYEHMSVGINFKVLDIDVFMRMCGKTTIDWYERLEPVIKHRRETNKNAVGGTSTIYKDFEMLVNSMREKYTKKDL